MMRLALVVVSLIVVSHGPVSAQSGRRLKETKTPPPPIEPAKEPLPSEPARADVSSSVTAERNQEYTCTDDGTLARVLDSESNPEEILSSKAVDTRVEITSKPKPSYTKEARRLGVQGFVVLKVVLSASGKVGRVRVVKRLPAGLTENAIKAVCKLEFKPAMKGGRPVSQWVDVEYVFRLADSSVFRP
ncbi:MAG TPA: energy transducer TonB [Pyrinomonadaceae bacterium]|nr:energy transducer TonB [Pyrinomonadaceae bacterium]